MFSKLCNKLIASRSLGQHIKETIVYDELNINEFVGILYQVRHLGMLKMQVIDKYMELSKDGSSPVCLFPTRKACKEFNNKILSALDIEIHNIVCALMKLMRLRYHTSGPKWPKKLNNDSNLTAGLKAELTLAVGARLML